MRNRWQTRYERRAEAITGIGNKVRDLQQDFLKWFAPSAQRLDKDPSRFEQSWQIVRRLYALDDYYDTHKPWLDFQTHRKFENLSNALEEQYLLLAKVLWANNAEPDSPYDEDKAAEPVHEWARQDSPGGLPEFIREWDEEVKTILGARPWWRRWFG